MKSARKFDLLLYYLIELCSYSLRKPLAYTRLCAIAHAEYKFLKIKCSCFKIMCKFQFCNINNHIMKVLFAITQQLALVFVGFILIYLTKLWLPQAAKDRC